MVSNQDDDHSSPETAESIIDQDWIDAGMTFEQVEQSKMLAQIEVRLSDEGHSIEDFYAECASSTPEKIINKYRYKLKDDVKKYSHSVVETDELHVIFLGMERKNTSFATIRLQINVDEYENLHFARNTVDLKVTGNLLMRVRSLREGQHVKIRMQVSQLEQGSEISLVDIKPAKEPQSTFGKLFQR